MFISKHIREEFHRGVVRLGFIEGLIRHIEASRFGPHSAFEWLELKIDVF